MLVTANFFDVLGLPMSAGRGFTADEAVAERDPHLAVVSHTFWQRDLGADPAVLGRSLTLNGASYTVVGVLAPNVRSVAGLGIAPPVYLPLSASLLADLQSPAAQVVELIGRLKAGQSLSGARAAIDAVDRRLARAAGDTLYGGVQQFGRAGTVGDTKRSTVAAFFGVLAVVSVLVLLIACANVAGLLVARGTTRRSEIAIRLAIGGTRARLVQQLMVEAFWLSLIGTLAGLGLGALAMRAINAMPLPVSLPIELHLALDPPVLLGALALVFVTMFGSALLPALGATRVSLTPALKRDVVTRAGRRLATRGLLLAGQVTVSTVLLVTAFLFLRNLQRTEVTSPGFDVDPVLVAQVGFIQGRPDADEDALLERLAERARGIGGVTSTAVATAVPLTMHNGTSNGRSVRFDAREQSEHVEYSEAHVGAGYFATLGIRLLDGRDFGPEDRAGAPMAVIVNEEFARKYLGGNAVGHRFRFSADTVAADREIVGVVANSKYRTIGEDLRPAIYVPMSQAPGRRSIGFVFTRVNGNSAAFVAGLRSALGAVDRAVSVDVQPMHSALAFAMLPSRVGAAVLGGLGLLGLVLAAFGLFAIVSYNVSRRVGEIAIRTALGATRGAIIALVVRDASVLVGVGVVAGLAISALATRVLSAFLVAGLSATDPASFIGTAGVFLLVTILASWLPARAATRVSPVVAMRLE
jgi:predicted permease